MDVPSVVSRSDIFLGRPNVEASQAMPLGNGRLGVAVWSANGFTAQLNRSDTMPWRNSPGQVVIPSLSVLTSAKNYTGRLDLYDGSFRETGGGLTATTFVQPDTDTLVVDVTGADPNTAQTVQLKLWAPRQPHALADNRVGIFTETWTDDRGPAPSGRTFGSLSAITAQGRNVTTVVTDPRTITLSVTPDPEGRFRVLVAAPQYQGTPDFRAQVDQAFADDSSKTHSLWWKAFWQHASIIKITSSDATGDYLENLRNLNLFAAAASSRGVYPGSHAGVADLFSSVQDTHYWDPSAFWRWNLRMQVAANLSAGLPELNTPYFRLYRENLHNITEWTSHHMGRRPGICVPETMRFDGQGYEYESGNGRSPITGLNCDAGSEPYYNARTLSTGAEVSLWIWQQYLATSDLRFLEENYPVMAASARFLLAYQKKDRDGFDHTGPSNAHETQWDTTDPTTDLAARSALYPATIEAAKLLGRDASLVQRLQIALSRIPAFPRTQRTGPLSVLSSSADQRDDMIADSYVPAAPTHNFENIGLEPVWPYNLISDTSPLFELARRTFAARRYVINQDWSFDPIQAARLGLADEVETTLVNLTTKYQTFVNGFANWGGQLGEFYFEQSGVVAAALAEALVQDVDDIIRIAPAVPPNWNFDGSVSVRSKTKVYVQVRAGTPVSVVIEAGSTRVVNVRNPWPGQAVDIVNDEDGTAIESQVRLLTLSFPAVAGGSYLLKRSGSKVEDGELVTGVRVASPKRLGPVQIGLAASP